MYKMTSFQGLRLCWVKADITEVSFINYSVIIIIILIIILWHYSTAGSINSEKKGYRLKWLHTQHCSSTLIFGVFIYSIDNNNNNSNNNNKNNFPLKY